MSSNDCDSSKICSKTQSTSPFPEKVFEGYCGGKDNVADHVIGQECDPKIYDGRKKARTDRQMNSSFGKVDNLKENGRGAKKRLELGEAVYVSIALWLRT